jgi:hypothetical protein
LTDLTPYEPTTTGAVKASAPDGNHSGAGGISGRHETRQPDVVAKSVVRSRAPRLAPMAAIRMHLQGPSRASRTVATHAPVEPLRDAEAQIVDQDVARVQKHRASEDSRGATGVTGLSPKFPGNSSSVVPEVPDERTLDGRGVSPHVNMTTSDIAPTVSYSIRGAAARPKSQAPPPPASDSPQRASPGSADGPNQSSPVRSRLLARLEAAKSVGTISNTDTETSHLAKKLSPKPTPSEISEAPVSEPPITAAQEELRLRLMAQSRLVRSASNRYRPGQNAPQENNVSWRSHQKEKADDPSVPAEVDSPTAMDTERRLRLQARLAARKRDITTLMGATSVDDALPL